MLEQLSSSEVNELLAFRYIQSGQYEEDEKKKNVGKLLRAQLGHKVKRKDGKTSKPPG
jgi:hypothetical protein